MCVCVTGGQLDKAGRFELSNVPTETVGTLIV